MINLVLIALVLFATWRSRGHLTFSLMFLVLLLAFHYVPLLYIYLNYDELPFALSLGEVGSGIAKVVAVGVALYLGSAIAGAAFRSGNAVPARAPRIGPWLALNAATGLLIFVNNLGTAYQSISGGYLEIYAASALAPVKTVTVLPVYAFSLFFLYLGWRDHRAVFSRAASALLLGSFGAVAVSFILTGSRSTVMYLIVSLVALYSIRYRRQMWRYLPHAAVLVTLSTVIGVMREGGLADIASGNLLLRPVMELGNTAIVFLTSESLSSDLAVSLPRYLEGLLYLFPVSLLSAFGIVPPPLLSQQYVSIVDPGWSDLGGGFGFSLVAEMYLLGGTGGAWLVALAIGLFLGWADVRARSPDIAKAALAASLGFLALFIVRGEIIELYRNVFVVVLLYLLSRLSLAPAAQTPETSSAPSI
jgi:oligosaccharide repeat unit polymerase